MFILTLLDSRSRRKGIRPDLDKTGRQVKIRSVLSLAADEISPLLAFMRASLVIALTALSATAADLVVPGSANIFGAGHVTAPNPGGRGNGQLPPVYSFDPSQDLVLTFSSVTGTVRIDNNEHPAYTNGPDGGSLFQRTEVRSYGGNSGVIHRERTMFLVGVFLDDTEPPDPAPPTLDFSPTGITDTFPALAPQLRQVFFVGDGLTGAGCIQQFIVPTGATRLFLGFADSWDFSTGTITGYPGWYDDDDGFLQATFSITQGPVYPVDRSWTSLGPEGGRINVLAMDPAAPQTIFAGTSAGVFKSIVGGLSWNLANTGLSVTNVTTLAMDPTAPQTIFAGTSGGVFKSTDAGSTWSPASAGLPPLSVSVLVVDPVSARNLYAGMGNEIYRSTDGGISWASIYRLSNASSVTALAIGAAAPPTLYAGTSNSGVFKSADGGTTWSPVNTGIQGGGAVSVLVTDPRAPQTVYAGTMHGLYRPGGVYKSTDGGTTWKAVNTGLTGTDVKTLVIDPTATQILYAGTEIDGIFRSADGGSNWTPVNMCLADKNVNALIIDTGSPQILYAGTPGGVWGYSMAPTTSTDLDLGAGGAAQARTIGSNEAAQAGYAKVETKSGAVPYGTAVFSFKENGVTVSEAGVPASPPTTQARLFIDYRSGVPGVAGRSDAGTVDIDTGIAIVNYGSATANITYTLRNVMDATISGGHGVLAAGAHFARFIEHLNEVAPDFNLPPDFPTTTGFGTLEISSNQPLSIVALREIINQRHEALFTTTPIADLSQPPATDPIYFPQFVDGGGYTTALVLLNTSNAVEAGTLQVFDDNGAPLAVNQVGGTTDSSFRYSIPVGGVFRFQTDGFPASVKAGWVLLTPDAGTSTPVGAGVFSYGSGGILVSESGIPAAVSTTHARVYVDLSQGHDTGLAIANPANTSTNITISAYQADGVTPIGTSQGTIQLPGNGHSAKFATEFIAGLPAGLTGVLDIASATPFAALTLRSLNNERNDFLMTTLPVADADRTAPSPVVFPQIADGGGFVTEFILLNAGGSLRTTLSFFDNEGSQLAVGKGEGGGSLPMANAPVFSPLPKDYFSAQSVTLSTAMPGAVIRYTTDGSTPTETVGTVYTGPILVASSVTIQAVAYLPGWMTSPVSSGTYTIRGTVAAPVFSPFPKDYFSAQGVNLSTATPGAEIRYTTDGSTPTETVGTVYTGPILVASSVTIQAVAYLPGWTTSPVSSGSYIIWCPP